MNRLETRSNEPVSALLRGLAVTLLGSVCFLGGCAALAPAPESEQLYTLEASPPSKTRADARDDVLVVSPPRVRAGYETSQIAYVRRAFQLEYFAVSRWSDAPSRMLAPLIVHALEESFRTVVRAPTTLPADLRLDTELILLQQDFRVKPSRFEVSLRAQLVDVRRNLVLATREFQEAEDAPSDDPYGGVIAANRALQRVLAQLTQFCTEVAPAPTPRPPEGGHG